MAPKKKGSKGKKKGGNAPVLDLEASSMEELNQKIVTLEREKHKEEEYRNYMQLERDKINAFWEITKKDLDDSRAELRNKDRDMEEMEERHQVEIKVYKQKVKHLLYEHQNSLNTQQADSQAALKAQEDEFQSAEDAMDAEKRRLQRNMREHEYADQQHVLQIRQEHYKEISMLRQQFELQAKELQSKYEKMMKALREDLELKRKQELHELEERKNCHIRELMRKHRTSFAEIKSYYNDITSNNLDLIKTLKDDVSEMKKKEALNEKLMYEIASENKRLAEPLSKALKEVELLRQQVSSADKDKAALLLTKQRLQKANKQFKNLEWEREVLVQRFAQVERERDELLKHFQASVLEVQQKTGLKGHLLERKVEALQEQLERKEGQLAEALASSNIDGASMANVSEKFDDVLSKKNKIIHALKYDVAKVSKAHNDLIRVYESKLAEFGVPAEELGFRPLVTCTAKGPAGLVVGA